MSHWSQPSQHSVPSITQVGRANLSQVEDCDTGSASKSGDKEPEWRFWTSLWRLKYSEAGRKKPGFRFISMNF